MVGWMDVYVLPLQFWMDRLVVTFTHSSHFILCPSVPVGTCVNFLAADPEFILFCGKFPHQQHSNVLLRPYLFIIIQIDVNALAPCNSNQVANFAEIALVNCLILCQLFRPAI
jgi:hypothetical protein